MAFSAISVRYNEISKHDIIIAIMGPTGSGKSNFIDVVTKSSSGEPRAGSSSRSCTEIRAVRLQNHESHGSKLVLVDVPSFDDDRRDMEILESIGNWLMRTYQAGIKLAGIIYMHRITDNRMAGSPYRNLCLFGKLCGNRAIQNVMLVTTMWDRLEAETGKRRERELVDRFWAKMIKHDASVGSFDNTESSALKIIQYFVDREASLQVLLIQEELADLKKRINETTVGMALHNHLLELLEKEKQALGKLESQAQQNANLAAAVEAERARTEERIENISNQLKASEISFSRKVRLFFKKQPKGKALVITESP